MSLYLMYDCILMISPYSHTSNCLTHLYIELHHSMHNIYIYIYITVSIRYINAPPLPDKNCITVFIRYLIVSMYSYDT